MLAKNEALQILKTYNIKSESYGPTIYQENDNIGICLDIKDSLFGYLTRAFIFPDASSLDNFLKGYLWYKNNHQKYNITLSLESYETKIANIKYMYNNNSLSIDDMLNMDTYLKKEQENLDDSNLFEIYLSNIEKLTEYLINLKKSKQTIIAEKNALKTKENDLKFELLKELTIYYDRNKNINKKIITLDFMNPPSDNSLLYNNINNLKINKSIDEAKNYLSSLINVIKEEELDEKNLVNIYSISVYKYNIEILNKQISFVKNKIASEKNFNIKGSKIHNIDEELKSFLKTNLAPVKVEHFIIENQNKTIDKFQGITNLENAYQIISGNKLTYTIHTKQTWETRDNVINSLKNLFDNEDITIKSNLILYNSFYKKIINYIIKNNYPNIEDIKKNFDFNYYYLEIEEIIYNINNNHYLINYFKNIDFKNLDTYINSIINIAKNIDAYFKPIPNNLKVFSINTESYYKHLTINNIESNTYLVEIPINTSIIYIPYKLEVDEANTIYTLNTNDIYLKESINQTTNSITLNTYHKKQIIENKITYTTDLILDKQIIYKIGTIGGQNE